MPKTFRALAFFVLLLGSTFASLASASQVVLRVDDDASPGGDGLSWATPYRDLQDALASAPANAEIRVAGGVQRPDRGVGQVLGAQVSTFQLREERLQIASKRSALLSLGRGSSW